MTRLDRTNDLELGSSVRRAIERESSSALRPGMRARELRRRTLDALIQAIIGPPGPALSDS